MHRINAIGLSFETERGVFDEIYFYDDEMRHEEDQKLKEAAFSHKYWPEQLDGRESKWIYKPKKKLNKKKLQAVLDAGCAYDGDDDDDDGEEGFEELCGGGGNEALARDFFSMEAEEASDGSGCGSELEDGAVLFPREGEEVEEDEDSWQRSPPSSAVAKFMAFILQPKFTNYVFLAHAGSRFDSILLLREIHARKIMVEPLFEGSKILQLSIPVLSMRFIDSYRYIKLPLSKFPSRFPKLQEMQLLKGMFPFKFNRPENYAYSGSLPGDEFFLDEFYSRDQEAKLKKFREERPADRPWTFTKELHAYLQDDVRVLRAGCLEFLKEMFLFQEDLNNEQNEDGWFHAFSRPFLTKSSFCHSLWVFFEMPPESLYLLTNQRGARKTSLKERIWLDYLISKGKHIKTAWNQAGGQKRICGYYPDGIWTDPVTGQVTLFEMMGCSVHFHSHFEDGKECPYTSKFHPNSKAPFGTTMERAGQQVDVKMRRYAAAGYTCIMLWECNFDKQFEQCEELRAFARSCDYPTEPLRLRTCLRGGRTEAFQMLYSKEANPERALFYIDKNS